MKHETKIEDPKELIENLKNLHASDIAYSLNKIYKNNNEAFYETLKQIPNDVLGEVILELPDYLKDIIFENLSVQELSCAINELESDDQTDFLQELEKIDKSKAKDLFEKLDVSDQEDINWLKKYDEEAGAYTQTELFSAKLDEKIGDSIEQLKIKKQNNELENIHQIFIVDDEKKLLATIFLEDLIIFDFNKTYKEVLDENKGKFDKPFKVQDHEHIDTVVKIFEQYNLNVIAVVGFGDTLIGRITSDDIIDVMKKNATEQIYQLAGVSEEYEEVESTLSLAKKRGIWLLINLATAILASIVIAFFDETIEKYVALAILMPIVASMGGNAGTQTLTVVVRKMALGEIDMKSSKEVIKKEVFVSIFNGLFFAGIIGIIASLWFNTYTIGVVIALSMIISLFSAGFFGASIPLLLKKFKIDPAVGSTVLLTTITDIVGFFSFLGLAKLMLI